MRKAPEMGALEGADDFAWVGRAVAAIDSAGKKRSRRPLAGNLGSPYLP